MAQGKSRNKKPKGNRQFSAPSYISNEKLQVKAFKVAKSVDKSALQSSTTVDTLSTYAFKLTDLPEYASYTTIFDQYRIDRIVLTFIPCTDLAIPGSTTGGTLQRAPPIYTAVDYDDNGTPASVATVLNYANVRLHAPGRMFKVSFKPHVAVGLYNGTNFTNYGNNANQWIDAASSDVLHFGLKTAMPSNALITVWQVIATYYVSFKNVR